MWKHLEQCSRVGREELLMALHHFQQQKMFLCCQIPTLLVNNQITPHHFTLYRFYGRIINYSCYAPRKSNLRSLSKRAPRQNLGDFPESPTGIGASPRLRCDHQLPVSTHPNGFSTVVYSSPYLSQSHTVFLSRR